MGDDLNREFLIKETQMAEKHLKCSTSLAVREVPIKTTLRLHLIPVRMSKSITQVRDDADKGNTPPLSSMGQSKLVQPL